MNTVRARWDEFMAAVDAYNEALGLFYGQVRQTAERYNNAAAKAHIVLGIQLEPVTVPPPPPELEIDTAGPGTIE